MALPIIPGILAAIAWFRGASLLRIAANIAIFYALKAVLTVLVTGVLAVVLHNVIVDFSAEMFQAALPFMDEHLPAAVIQLTGQAAWVAIQLRFAECLAVILSALSVSFVRQIVPGL